MIDTKALREKILDLAMRGKLVPQDPNDEPASELLKRIKAEKEELIKQKKIKRDKNETEIFRGDDGLHYEKFTDGTVKEIEVPYELPVGWEWARIASATKILLLVAINLKRFHLKKRTIFKFQFIPMVLRIMVYMDGQKKRKYLSQVLLYLLEVLSGSLQFGITHLSQSYV